MFIENHSALSNDLARSKKGRTEAATLLNFRRSGRGIQLILCGLVFELTPLDCGFELSTD